MTRLRPPTPTSPNDSSLNIRRELAWIAAFVAVGFGCASLSGRLHPLMIPMSGGGLMLARACWVGAQQGFAPATARSAMLVNAGLALLLSPNCIAMIARGNVRDEMLTLTLPAMLSVLAPVTALVAAAAALPDTRKRAAISRPLGPQAVPAPAKWLKLVLVVSVIAALLRAAPAPPKAIAIARATSHGGFSEGLILWAAISLAIGAPALASGAHGALQGVQCSQQVPRFLWMLAMGAVYPGVFAAITVLDTHPADRGLVHLAGPCFVFVLILIAIVAIAVRRVQLRDAEDHAASLGPGALSPRTRPRTGSANPWAARSSP